MRAACSGVLDRALDTAAALEVRGYGVVRRPDAHRTRMPYSRHDLAFLASAGGIVALSIVSRATDLAPFAAYPALQAPTGAGAVGIAAGLLAVAMLPFADRRGLRP
jgi:energy-coupling factor transport system permease protein